MEGTVEYEAGEINSYAYYSLRFYYINSSGHTAVEVKLEENVATEFRPEEKSKLSLELLFEPNELDIIQRQLMALAKNEKGKAVLKGKNA